MDRNELIAIVTGIVATVLVIFNMTSCNETQERRLEMQHKAEALKLAKEILQEKGIPQSLDVEGSHG